MDETLAVKQFAVVLRIDGLAVEIEHQNVGRGHRFRRDRARHQIAARIARIAHADMAEGIEHIQPRQRAVRRDEIVDELRIEPACRPERREAAERGEGFVLIYRISQQDRARTVTAFAASRKPPPVRRNGVFPIR